MNHMLTSAIALALVAAAPAMAKPDANSDQTPNQTQKHQGQGGQHGQGDQTGHGGGAHNGRGGGQGQQGHQGGQSGAGGDQRANGGDRGNGGGVNNPWPGANANHGGLRPQNWNNRPRQFDRRLYQRTIRAARRFHVAPYSRPNGWYYRQWRLGDRFPRQFWARNFWISDWWMYGLQIPPFGYEWVRYGDDAVLVNTYTGEILEVVYGLYY